MTNYGIDARMVFDQNGQHLGDVPTQLAQIVSQVVNVKNPPVPLVACKGDGTTDDTVAINNIISTVSSPYIYLPSGTYRVQYISFINDLHIFGDGADKTIIKRVDGFNTSTGVFDTTHPEHGNLLGNMASPLSSQNNVTVKGICFDGNVQNVVFDAGSTLPNMFNNVQIYYMANLVIRECKFINSIGDGLFIAGNRNAVIENSYFNHCGYNTKPGANTTQNCMSTFGSYYNSSTSSSSMVETNTTIKNCFFNDANSMGIVSRNPKSLIIDSCEFTNISSSNLELYGDSQSSATSFNTFDNRFIIKNNIFQGANVTHGDPNKNYKEVFIFENNIMNAPSSQFFVQSTATADLDVFVKNNKFLVSQLYFTTVNRVNVQNNDIQFYLASGSNNAGIYLGSCNYPLLADNNIYYAGSDTVNATGIGLFATTIEPIIINNIFSSAVACTKECIKFSYTDGSTLVVQNIRILGNKISGFNRGVNISSGVNNTVLINSNIFDVPTAGDYCIYQWSSVNAKKGMCTGNVLLNNTNITIAATTKVITNNV